MPEDEDLEWVDAPPKRWGPRSKPLVTAAQEAKLRANPGRWAKVQAFPGSSSAHQARKRWRDNPQHLVTGEWEAEARKFPDGTSAVFARFVGGLEGGVPDQGPDGKPEPRSSGADDSMGSGSPRRRSSAVEPATVENEEPEPADPPPVDPPRSRREQRAGSRDDERALAVPASSPLAVVETEEVDESQGRPCGPCRRGRCQFCADGPCECDRPDHFQLARRSTA